VGRRILFSVYGSAGDLFPLIPVILRLRDAGHDVRCAVPRPLVLYLRPLGVPVHPLGQGDEARLFREPALLSTRFDGWDSVRRLSDQFLAESLAADVVSVESLVSAWAPDVVVSATFAACTRIVAHRQGIAHLDTSIYPQVLASSPRARRISLRYRSLCADLAGLPPDEVDERHVTWLAWGAGQDTIVLHDPELIGPPEPMGFPYWDRPLHRQADTEAVDRWLGEATGPSVAVTMGSYLGARRPDLWERMIDEVVALGVRGLFLGPRRQLEQMLQGVRGDCLAAGFVPLSLVAGRVSAVVHHGGIGTMFAALRAGTPAVVVPLAFDQPFNARLVEGLGVGLRGGQATWPTALSHVLTDRSFAQRCAELSKKLVPSELATERAVARITERAA
jgi:UDP:flavonoid glycosyltransferase YjiC (YdhE family)